MDTSYVSLELRNASHARLVAPSLAIASGEATYTLRRHAADSVPHFERSLWWPWYKIPCAYIWVPFQLRRSLVAFGIDLPVLSVHGAVSMAQGRMTRQRRLHAIRRSITHFMVAPVSAVRHIRSKRARSRPNAWSSSPFR
jgi:hypothetical protein